MHNKKAGENKLRRGRDKIQVCVCVASSFFFKKIFFPLLYAV